MLITQPQFSDVSFQSNIQMGQKNNLQNNNLFKVFEEPEEPIPEEEIPEEAPIVEEVEEEAPPRGTADFMDWTFRSLSFPEVI